MTTLEANVITVSTHALFHATVVHTHLYFPQLRQFLFIGAGDVDDAFDELGDPDSTSIFGIAHGKNGVEGRRLNGRGGGGSSPL